VTKFSYNEALYLCTKAPFKFSVWADSLVHFETLCQTFHFPIPPATCPDRPLSETTTKAHKTIGPIYHHHHHLLTAVTDSLRPVTHSHIDCSLGSDTLGHIFTLMHIVRHTSLHTTYLHNVECKASFFS